MKKFMGECIGGPDDKKWMVHWDRSKKYYRPMVAFTLSSDPPVEAVEIGEYRLNDYGHWHWHATEAGRAFEKLFGPPISGDR